jgi:hypothetical protein
VCGTGRELQVNESAGINSEVSRLSYSYVDIKKPGLVQTTGRALFYLNKVLALSLLILLDRNRRTILNVTEAGMSRTEALWEPVKKCEHSVTKHTILALRVLYSRFLLWYCFHKPYIITVELRPVPKYPMTIAVPIMVLSVAVMSVPFFLLIPTLNNNFELSPRFVGDPP